MKSSIKENVTVVSAPKWIRNFIWVLLGLAGLLGLAALCLGFGWAEAVRGLMQEGWGPYAAVIMRNKIGALWHGAFMAVCAAGFVWLFLAARRRSWLVLTLAQWGAVLLVAADALYLARHYIQTMPLADMAENEVLRRLKDDMPDRRVVVAQPVGFYNHWLTYQFPYHRIRVLNVTQMPRMPVEYKRFLDAVGGLNSFRLWQLAGVGYVLAPAQVWGQIQQDPGLREAFELVYAYNVQQAGMQVQVIPATAANPGQHVVLRFKLAGPRFMLLGGWEKMDDQEALARLASGNQRLFEKALVAPESAAGLPALTGTGMVGNVWGEKIAPERLALAVNTVEPAILRIADKFDPDWKAWVDDRPAPLLRVDYIFQGVFIEPGRHTVVLRYAPPVWPLGLQGLGALLCLGAIARIIARRRAAAAADAIKLNQVPPDGA
jgi:hypothetical protein